MIDGYEYQKQKRREQKELKRKNKKQYQGMSDEIFALLASIVALLVLTVILFVMQWNALQEGREECESKGGEWSSKSTGKLTITDCKMP